MAKTIKAPKKVKKLGHLAPSLSWLPDWSDEKQYPDPQKTTPQQWAWEFLRRNPVYRNLRAEILQSYKESFGLDEPGFTLENIEKITLKRGSNGELVFNYPTPDMEPLGAGLQMFNTLFGLLQFPPDPERNRVRLRLEPVKLLTRDEMPKGKLLPDEEIFYDRDEIVCILNRDYPLKEQLRYIEEALKKVKFSNKRARYQSFRTYLRVLDAYERGISHKAMASVLYSNKSNDYESGHRGSYSIRDNLKSAIKLRDRGYRYLVTK